MTTPVTDTHLITDVCCSDMNKMLPRVHQIAPLAARQRAYSAFICPSVPPSSSFSCQFSLHRIHLSDCYLLPRSRRSAVMSAHVYLSDISLLRSTCAELKKLATKQVFAEVQSGFKWRLCTCPHHRSAPAKPRPVAIVPLRTCSPTVWAFPASLIAFNVKLCALPSQIAPTETCVQTSEH